MNYQFFNIRNFLLSILRLGVVGVFVLCAYVKAYSDPSVDRPTVLVPGFVKINSNEIHLGDIARITVFHAEHDGLGRALREVSLGEAPPPRMKRTITGYALLAAIESAGIRRDQIGYAIPKTVVVERSGRLVTTDEVLAEAQKLLSHEQSLDLQVREVRWSTAQAVPEGESRIALKRLGQPQRGKVPMRATVFVNEKPEARFLLTAVVDDWREVPVLNTPLERGMLIKPEDIEMIRLNLLKHPAGIADKAADVIGRRVVRKISAGETIRKKFINIPPIVPKGKTVTMRFNGHGIQATAIGLALEDGGTSEIIKVKNTASRKIVRARVLGSDQVEVMSR